MTDAPNIIPFARPRPEPPGLRNVEIRLDEDGSIELTVFDAAGDVVASLAYVLACKPDDFDLGRLHDAWTVWRETSTVAR